MLRRNRNDPQFSQKILWSNKSLFQRTEIFNIHNLHHWPFELQRRLNDEGNLNFLQNHLNGLLHDVSPRHTLEHVAVA